MSSGPVAVPRAPAGDQQPPDGGADRSRRRWLAAGGAAVAVLVLYLGAEWATSARVPRGTSVGGVEVGGLGRDAAIARLRAASTSLGGALPVQANGRSASLDLAEAGLSLDPERTVDELTGFTLSPVALWRQVAGGGDVPPLPEPSPQTLEKALTAVAGSLATPAEDASIAFVKGAPVLAPATEGTAVKVPESVDAVLASWLSGPRPLTLPTGTAAPAITAAEGEEALEKVAKPAVSGPLTVKVGDESVTLEPAELAPALSMKPQDGRLVLAVDGPKLRRTVLAEGPQLGSKPKDARIVLKDGRPTVIPGVAGVTLEAADLAAAAVPALTDEARTAVVRTAVQQPDLTTEEAKKLGVKERISTFSTVLTANSQRTENLRIAARTVDGTLVLPGQTFSLNEVLGRRTPEKGYNQAPAISGGRLVNDYGGGVSQMATTIFNNVFFAGLEDVYHKPHSFYISRYPEGREATVNYPTVDLKWRNDSKTAVLISAKVDSKVRVSFYGTKTWEIDATKSARSNYRTPETVYDDQPECVVQEANAGFDVSVTRIFRRPGSSAVVKRETFNTVYNAEDKVICGPEPAED